MWQASRHKFCSVTILTNPGNEVKWISIIKLSVYPTVFNNLAAVASELWDLYPLSVKDFSKATPLITTDFHLFFLLFQSCQDDFSPGCYRVLHNWNLDMRATIPSYSQVLLTFGGRRKYRRHVHQEVRVLGAILAFCLPQPLLHMMCKNEVKMDQRHEHKN